MCVARNVLRQPAANATPNVVLGSLAVTVVAMLFIARSSCASMGTARSSVACDATGNAHAAYLFALRLLHNVPPAALARPGSVASFCRGSASVLCSKFGSGGLLLTGTEAMLRWPRRPASRSPADAGRVWPCSAIACSINMGSPSNSALGHCLTSGAWQQLLLGANSLPARFRACCFACSYCHGERRQPLGVPFPPGSWGAARCRTQSVRLLCCSSWRCLHIAGTCARLSCHRGTVRSVAN